MKNLQLNKYVDKIFAHAYSINNKLSLNNKTSPLRVWKFAAAVQYKLAFEPDKQKIGIWMKDEISNLGPAFIKLGQFISTRQSVFGKDISKELSYLQDDIRPVDSAIIRETIEQSLARPIADIFESFEDTCIGSASIGQVHRAQLKNKSMVAIKVQKPNIAQLIREDLETMRNMVTFFSITGNPRAAEFNNILIEYERFLSAELDYTNEINQMVYFYNATKDQPVQIPRVYRNLSSPSIIVMEYVPSIKITDVASLQQYGIDKVSLANLLINVFLVQIIKKGIVHADPHPGNIGVLEDGKTLVLYDFGNVVRFTDEFKASFSQLIFSVVQKDVNEFVDLLIKLDILSVYDDNEVEEIKSFFVYFFNYLETLDFTKLKSSIIQDDIQGKFQENLRVNPDFMSLFRVFSLLDGTCSKLDPNFSYINVLTPYNQELLQDINFIDSRARKDLQKMTSYTRTIESTYTTSVKTQRKMKNMQDEFQQVKILIALLTVIENVDNLVPVSLFMTVYYIYVSRMK